MSNINSSTKMTKNYKHLNKTERENIKRWLKEEKSKSEIVRLLDRDRSTITREIKRGTVTQIKTINGYDKEIEQYYAEAGQAVYEKNRKRSKSKGLKAFSQNFWEALKEANKNKLFSGKIVNITLKPLL